MGISRKTAAVGAIAILILCGGVFTYLRVEKSNNNDQNLQPTQQEQSNEGAVEKLENPADINVAPSQQTNSPTPGGTVPTPTLLKSAGNGPAAPANVLMSFTCQGPSGYKCGLQLISTSGQKVNFDNKDISANSRGSTEVSWEWTTQPGTWQVEAILYSSNNNQSSGAQKFDVQ